MMARSDGKRTGVSGVETVGAGPVKRDPADTTKLIVGDRPVPRVYRSDAVDGDFHGRCGNTRRFRDTFDGWIRTLLLDLLLLRNRETMKRQLGRYILRLPTLTQKRLAEKGKKKNWVPFFFSSIHSLSFSFLPTFQHIR